MACALCHTASQIAGTKNMQVMCNRIKSSHIQYIILWHHDSGSPLDVVMKGFMGFLKTDQIWLAVISFNI